MSYDPKKLPDGFRWVGAVAGPDGYNGHAMLANVAMDSNKELWCFAAAGRYRVSNWWFNKRQISDHPLIQAPLKFDPVTTFPV